MTDDWPSIKQLWSNQATEGFTMSLEDIRARSTKMQLWVRIRNLVEYAASVLVVAIFGIYIVMLPGVVTKLGSAMIIVATFYVVWQLHKRGSSHTPPLGDSVLDHVAFYRSQLIRQRDALRSVPTWYLAPFVPGLVVFITGIALRAPSLQKALPYLVGVTALMIVVFGAVWLLNRWGASRLQKMIDALARTGVE